MAISHALTWQIRGVSIIALISALLLTFLVPMYESKRETRLRDTPPPSLQIIVLTLFGLAIIKLVAESYSPFLYFQF